MKLLEKKLIILLIIFSLNFIALSKEREVYVIKVNGAIGTITVEYITQSLEKAEKNNVEAFIILLNTPGGLLEATYNIVEKILNSSVPVVVFVYPKGARAASAGVFLTLSANIAAMAPATNIGAAHPVTLTGQGIGEGEKEKPSTEKGEEKKEKKPQEKSISTMEKKILNDTIAKIKTIAKNRGRNPKWAEDAVRISKSSTEEEALKENVIDLIAKDLDDLLQKIDGWEVETSKGKKILHTKNAKVVFIEMTWRQRFLDLLANPNIAYLLMIFGFLGLYIEITHPGLILPGVIGGICLILFLFSVKTLPINIAGLLLIILSFIFFGVEFKVHSYGLLTIGGIIALIIGSIMLINSPLPFMKVSLKVIIPVVIAIGGIVIFLVSLVIKAHAKKSLTGPEGLIGSVGKALENFDNYGNIFIHGEIWKAITDEPVKKGQSVQVVDVDGLKLKIKPLNQE